MSRNELRLSDLILCVIDMRTFPSILILIGNKILKYSPFAQFLWLSESVCLSGLPVCQSACLLVSLSVSLPVCLYVSLPVSLPFY